MFLDAYHVPREDLKNAAFIWVSSIKGGSPRQSKGLGVLFNASALWADAFYKLKCPYICLFVCLFVCLFTFEVPLNSLFSPTSPSWMSNIFRDSESSGKGNETKLYHIWTFQFGSGLKSLRKKKVFFCWGFGLTKHGKNHASRWFRDLWSKGISLILAYL